jgi:arginine-tRNA-protein transferase
MNQVPLWLTSEQNCSYLDNKLSQSAVVHPDFALDIHSYSRLIEQGFRRSGDQVYKPYCNSCEACVPTRIPVVTFQASRSHKRCAKRNVATQVRIKPPRFDSRHFQLYQHYQANRHDKDSIDAISPADYMHFLSSSWCNTWFVEFLIADQLAAVAVVDVLDHALSAVYTFFDPAFNDFSPGTYAVLWQIEQARLLKLDFVYLGFWIKDCRKMRYKIQYQPLQGLINQHWQAVF